MKQLTIEIPKETVFEEVARTTAYLGAKGALAAASGEIYDRVATDEADSPLLGAYLDEAVASLVQRLKGMVMALNVTPERVRVTFALSGSYDDAMTPVVEQGFTAYLTAAVTADWLRMADPAKEARWREEALAKADALTGAIYFRKAPCRRKTSSLNKSN